MRIRVCHICSGHSIDDSRVFHRSCSTLASAGYDVHLIARGKQLETFICKGVVVHSLPAPPNRALRIWERTQIADLARRLNPDLYHVHEPELLGPVISRRDSRPVVWDVHESYLDVLMNRAWIPAAIRPLARGLWDLRERILLRQCAGVVAATESVAARYKGLGVRVEVVANFPQLSRFESFEEYLPRDGRTCVFVGGLSKDRGLHQAILALSILRKRGLDVPLLFAG